jgi:hypothetical protein
VKAPLRILLKAASHKVITRKKVSILCSSDCRGEHSLSKVVVIFVSGSVRGVSTAGDQGSLCLSSLGLLAALVSGLLLSHLLVTQGSQSGGELLDLLAVHLLGKRLGEVLEE